METIKNFITTGRCDVEIMLDVLNTLHFSLEPCENEKYRLYDNQLCDYARSYDDEIFEESSADSVIEALDTYINDSYVADLQEEADSYNISDTSYKTSIGSWNDYIEDLNNFIENHQAELEDVAFINDYERVSNVRLSNVIRLETAKNIADEIGLSKEFQANFDNVKNNAKFMSEAILQSLSKAFLSNEKTKNFSLSYNTKNGGFLFKSSAVGYEAKYYSGLLRNEAITKLSDILIKHAKKNFGNIIEAEQFDCLNNDIYNSLYAMLKDTSVLDIQQINSTCSLSQISPDVIIPYMETIKIYIDKEKLKGIAYNVAVSSGNLDNAGGNKHISMPLVDLKDAEALMRYYTYANRFVQNNGKRIKNRKEYE